MMFRFMYESIYNYVEDFYFYSPWFLVVFFRALSLAFLPHFWMVLISVASYWEK